MPERPSTKFWNLCHQLLIRFPDHPEKFAGDAEAVELTRQIRPLVAETASQLVPSNFWRGDASVGKGNWTNVPWIAFFDERETVSAQRGVYPVIHLRCDNRPGIRIGLGVAATEFKSNPEAKAQEVRSEFERSALNELEEVGFLDVTQPDLLREEIGSGKLATSYSRGMIFEQFVKESEILGNLSQLDKSVTVLLASYKDWVEQTQSKFAPPTFPELMSFYHDHRIVFLSTSQKSPYLISSVDDSGCTITRIDSQQEERISFASYDKKLAWLKDNGGSAERRELDYTVAKEACYLQGSQLGLSADSKTVTLISSLSTATKSFVDRIEAVTSPQLYKPAILKLVVEAVGRGELTQNEIQYDWLLPRFVDFFQQRGRNVSGQQLTEGFARLRNEFFWLLAYKDPVLPLEKTQPKPAAVKQFVSHAILKEPYWTVIQDAESRSRILETIDRKLNLSMEDPNDIGVINNELPLAKRTEELISAIHADGFTFEPWQIAAYITAVRTKPFVILAGVSGTGKSQLPKLIAKHTGGRSQRVSVRPDWSDSSEVLGYVDLQGIFRPGVVLDAAVRAAEDQQRYHISIIDEMNLARVEYYFAEVLSCIEDRHQDPDGGYRSGSLLSFAIPNDADKEWEEACIPPNLALIGTVNMDESTHGFSRKVIDRAFTIELSEVDLDWTPQPEATQENVFAARWPISAWHTPAIRLGDLSDLTENEIESINDTIEVLKTINQSLARSQLQVGYRTRDEVVLFVLNARDVQSCFRTESGEPVDALDLAISMKILPRIVGGSNAIRQTLCALMAICISGNNDNGEDQAATNASLWNSAGRPAAMSNAKYPRTAARICLMWDRLENEGFTSYWL